MGTHPIFESDFDCLTEREKKNEKKQCSVWHSKVELWLWDWALHSVDSMRSSSTLTQDAEQLCSIGSVVCWMRFMMKVLTSRSHSFKRRSSTMPRPFLKRCERRLVQKICKLSIFHFVYCTDPFHQNCRRFIKSLALTIKK